jgi:hypothetical protein
MKLDFSLDDLPEMIETSYDPLPPGWYQARVAAVEARPNKANTGQYLAVRYDIIGPTHQGRVIYGNLNISNPSAKAEQIGRQQLGQLMMAIGLERISDTDQLIGGTCEIKLEIRPADGQYKASNDVKGWKAFEARANGFSAQSLAAQSGAQSAAQPPAQPGAATSQALSGQTPPWKKRS